MIKFYRHKNSLQINGRMNDRAYELLGDEIVINKSAMTLKLPTIDSKKTYTVTTTGKEHIFSFCHPEGFEGVFEVVDAGKFFKLEEVEE